ncbi:Na+/H+ antiporter NhaA [soil metagenome]
MKAKSKSTIKWILNVFSSGGILLLAMTIISLLIANSSSGDAYREMWEIKVGPQLGVVDLNKTLGHWINDGLMVIFFLLVGLEIKRELLKGELSSRKKAMLPLMAAVGGMVIPALIYTFFNIGHPAASGWGIPMATDIAFALAILTMAGNRVPLGLKIFLTALAIIDDLGAVLVIAFFYTHGMQLLYLLLAVISLALLAYLNYKRIQKLRWYLIPGILLWYFILKSGVHATIAGVLIALFIPIEGAIKNKRSALERLEHILHGKVNYFILPLFALANTALLIDSSLLSGLSSSPALGIIFGLFAGKPIGIMLFSFIAVRSGMAVLPSGTDWIHILGAGFLGGIGFTMSIFIAMLAFHQPEFQNLAKFAVLMTSVVAGVVGFAIIKSK